MNRNKKIRVVSRKHGAYTKSVFLTVVEMIRDSDEGYYMAYYESLADDVSEDLNEKNIEKVREVILDCVNAGLFDQTVYEQYKVLTSKRIQEDWKNEQSKTAHKKADVKKYNLIVEESEASENFGSSQDSSGNVGDCRDNSEDVGKNRDSSGNVGTIRKKSEVSGNVSSREDKKREDKKREDKKREDKKREDIFFADENLKKNTSDADAFRIVSIWNDVCKGTDYYFDGINVSQIVLFNIKKRIERGTTDEEFRRVFEKARDCTDFGWTLPVVFNKEDNFDQIRARKEGHNNSPVRESGYSDQRNYNHLYSAKGTDEPLPARYTEEVTI